MKWKHSMLYLHAYYYYSSIYLLATIKNYFLKLKKKTFFYPLINNAFSKNSIVTLSDQLGQ